MTDGAENAGTLRVACFNAQSLCNKVCGTLEMLKDRAIDVCCVTETWFRSKEKSIFAEIHDFGFEVLSSPRRGKGGGVAFLFNPDRVSLYGNVVKGFKSFEIYECIIKTAKKMLRFCTVYRTTRSKDKTKYEETKVPVFLEEFEQYLDCLVEKGGAPVICGDFNFHVEDSNDVKAKKFKSLYESKGFFQHITGATHVSGGTLDLVLTLNSCTDKLPIKDICIESATGTTSDHYLVYFDLPDMIDTVKNIHDEERRDIREFKNMDIDQFREDLFCSPLNMSELTSVDQAIDVYHKTVETILNKHAPLISRSFKKNRSPWWDNHCQTAKQDMRKAQRKFYKNKNDSEAQELFNEKCIDKAIIINRARNSYFDQKLSSSKGDPKGTYKVINHLLDKEYGSGKLPHREDDEALADEFQSFFSEKVQKIYSTIQKDINESHDSSSDSHQDIMSSQYCVNNKIPNQEGSAFGTFNCVSVEELLELAQELPNKSCDLDPLPMWLFKACLPELINIIHYIVNESLKTGVFPTDLKTAIVRPSLKKPTLDSDVLENYRPISNLEYISKLIEKVVHKQLVEYLDKEKLFPKFQSAYRKFHSCETAVTKIYNDLLIMMDKRDNVVLLLLDLSAAFDTINHNILLNRLQNIYGITGTAIQLIRSYLSKRKLKVSVNGAMSSESYLEIGVPQGSIIGPLLFILYTRDLEEIVTKYGFSIHLYADDTQIYFSFDVHSTNPDLSAIKSCLQEVKEWMTNNFLKLNDGKTEFLDIGYYVSPLKSLELDNIGKLSITPALMAKNLGFYFDHQLNMNDQISLVSQICYLNLRDLKRIGSKLNQELKIQLVHSNILCFIDYCNASYGGLTRFNIQRLQKLQNNAARFIFQLNGKKKWQHIKPYLKKLHFLPVEYRIKFKISMLVFKCLNNMAPEYLKDLISLREAKRINMRMDNDFYLLKSPKPPRFSRTEAAFMYIGPKLWNELPYFIRCMTELETFKKSLKTYYFEIAFNGIE